MQSFFILFNRYLAETAKNEKMCVLVHPLAHSRAHS